MIRIVRIASSIQNLVFLFLIAITVVFAVMHPSDAMNQDLGRHLKLGEIILETKSVPATNLFSYTYPNHPFINHHWLSEVLFYLLNKQFGLMSLYVLKLVLIALALLLTFISANRLAGLLPAVISSTLLLPLVIERTDERPELFGFVFFALLFLILFSKERVNKKLLLFVPLIILLWVNMHITFIYGILLLGVFTVKEVWRLKKESYTVRRIFKNKETRKQFIFFSSVFFASLMTTLLNPNGIQGAIIPFTVLTNYGYEIIENQTVFHLMRTMRNPLIPYFFITAFITCAATLYAAAKSKKFHSSQLVFLLFMASAVRFIRNFPFFMLAAIPAFALVLKSRWATNRSPAQQRAIIAFFLAVNAALGGALYYRLKPRFEIKESYKPGVDFFLAQNIPGNIFNDFDIGGYLDYRLYPKYKTFVDNRPDAFPAEFFKAYKAMQYDAAFRNDMFAQQGITSIIFSRTDKAVWTKEFLNQMDKDPNWQRIYLDKFTVVFRKKNVSAQ